MTTDMANLQTGKSEGTCPGRAGPPGMEQQASITAAAVIVRGQDAGRTGSGQRSGPRAVASMTAGYLGMSPTTSAGIS